MNMLGEILIVTLGFCLFLALAKTKDSIFEYDEHGLGYVTEKKMFMLTTLSVTGKSHDIHTKLEFNTDRDQYRIHVSVPVDSLDSGMRDRDKSVQDFLQKNQHPNITFTSDWMAYDSLNFDKHLNKSVPGELSFSGKRYSVEFPLNFIRHDNFTQITGVLESTFTKLDMACPKVVGGLVADVKDKLDIFVNLRSDKIEGLEELLTAKKEVSELG